MVVLNFSNVFLDINECEDPSVCHVNATCDNTPGSYTCTCEPGLSGDGKDTCVGKFWFEFVHDKGRGVTNTFFSPGISAE